ncbi:peptidase family M28 [Diplocarpon rosae]|nr:peptidase family M28 [Diplocarpon rosae]
MTDILMKSTAGDMNARAPGAVDNASTVVALLEALRVLSQQQFQAQHNIEFHFYAGSKGGRLGSKDVMAKYVEEQKDIIAFLHQARIGYTRSEDINVYNDFSNPALVKYISAIAAENSGKVFTWGYCGTRCNDHVSAHEKGYSYVTGEVFYQDYFDTPRDTLEKINYKAVERHAKFTIAYVVEAGNY